MELPVIVAALLNLPPFGAINTSYPDAPEDFVHFITAEPDLDFFAVTEDGAGDVADADTFELYSETASESFAAVYASTT